MGRTSEENTSEALAAIPTTESLVGVFVSQSGAIATVDQGGARLEVKSTAFVSCLPGDAVRLERRDGQLVLMGPVRARATLGRITVAGSPATVEYPNGSGVTAVLPVNPAVTVAVNDSVLIDWASGGLVVCKASTAAPPPPPPTPGPAPGTVITQTFTAIDSASYQAPYGWRTREVWASSSNIGAWFYGTKIKDTIPDTAAIMSASIWLPIKQNSGAAPNLGMHNAAYRPGGVVAVGSTFGLGTRSGQVGIPTSWLDTLKAGDGGIGFNHGGYNIYFGIDADGNSGAITVTYSI